MPLKTQLSDTLRRLGLLGAADHARFLVERVRNRAKNRAFLAAQPHVAVPPPYFVYETFQLDYAKYYHGGREVAAWIRGHVADVLPSPEPRVF